LRTSLYTSWEKDNFEQLFEDIKDAIDVGEKQYFLGSILLQERENESNSYDLVDGQQRISSLAILMAVIRDTTENQNLKTKLASYLYQEEDPFKKIPAEMRIMPWEDLRNLFISYVYETDGTKRYLKEFENNTIKYNDSQDPKYHLYEAISVFNEKIAGGLNDSFLEKYITYLLNNVYLVYIKTGSFASAYRLFSVLNTRGLGLYTSDLLKSENVGEIKDEALRLQYANLWRDIENKIGRDELENVIAFIRTIKLKDKARLSIYDEYKKYIYAANILKRGKEFIDHLKEIADIYKEKIVEGEIVSNAAKKGEYKNIVALMRRFVPFLDWMPPLIAFYNKFKVDEPMPDFVQRLEKKVIIEWVAGFSLSERQTSLNKIIRLIDEETNPVNVNEKLLFYKPDEITAGRPARSVDYGQKSQIEAILADRLNDSQFYSIYGGKVARYLLLRIDLNNWELENFPGYPGTITVEHILPQGPEKESEWTDLFTEDQRRSWTNRIGNLVLLSGGKNSKARNFEFKTKKDAYFKGKSTAFKITQYLEGVEKWTLDELEKRHWKLIQDATEIFLNY
jgi:uncharacterized protein with ParB-like and HNH nuclease domain